MKLLKLLFLFGLIYSASAQSRLPNLIQRIIERGRNAMNQQIINLIESQRENIGLGWPELGIPPFDPFLIEDIQFVIDTLGTLSSINFRLRDAYFRGLQQFEIEKFDLRILGLSVQFDIFFTQLVLDGHHETRASLASRDVSGDGPITMVFNDFRVNTTISLNTTKRGYLNIKELILSVNVGTVNANLRGFGSFLDPTISSIFSLAMPGIINDSSERINDEVSNTIVPALNEILNQYRLDDLITAAIRIITGRTDGALNYDEI